MIYKICILFLLSINSAYAQLFSIEQEDSLKNSLNNYLKSPDKESRKLLTYLKNGSINMFCSIIAETNFKNSLTEFNVKQILSKEEIELYKKIHFRIDSTTSFVASKSVSSRWDNNQTPYIEYYPKWVLGFINYQYADIISNATGANRKNYSKVFRIITAVNDSADAVSEAYLDDEYVYRVIYSMENTFQTLLYNYSNYLFIFLHEFSHLAYPTFSEIEADRYATEKILKLIHLAFPKGSQKEDAVVSEKLNKDIPEDFSKFSFYYMALQHIEYLNSKFLFPPYNYNETIKELITRKKFLYQTLAEVLRCNDKRNSTTIPCQEIGKFILQDEMDNNLIIERINLLDNWKAVNKNNSDTAVLDIITNSSNPSLNYFSLAIMLCEAKKYTEALVFLNKALSFPDISLETREYSFLLAGKIYQYRIINKALAIDYYLKAKSCNAVMPTDFYNNMLKSLQ